MPPLAGICHRKSAPAMAEGGASAGIARGSAVMERGIERVTGNPLESVTRMVMVLLARVEGLPPRTPVDALMESPRGRSPVADHL